MWYPASVVLIPEPLSPWYPLLYVTVVPVTYHSIQHAGKAIISVLEIKEHKRGITGQSHTAGDTEVPPHIQVRVWPQDCSSAQYQRNHGNPSSPAKKDAWWNCKWAKRICRHSCARLALLTPTHAAQVDSKKESFSKLKCSGLKVRLVPSSKWLRSCQLGQDDL